MNKNYTLILLISLTLTFGAAVSQDYFPLYQGSWWIYNVYQDGNLSYVDSVVYRDQTEVNDTTFYRFVHHYIENKITVMTDTFYLFTNQEDNNTMMLSNRNMDVIDSAVYAKHSYNDGEWWVARKIPQDDTIKVEMIGDVTVTAGTFSDCYIQGEEYILAPDIGIIKILLWNETSYYDLVRYHIQKPTGLMDKEYPGIEIFPNPANEYLHIRGINNGAYKVVDLSGRTIISGIFENGFIYTGQFNPGIYYLLIEKDGKVSAVKFMKH